jgi:hypothetical protein
VDRKAVTEQQHGAVGDSVTHLALPDIVVQLIGHEHHHEVAATRRLDDRQHLEPGLARRDG